jgi:hypothetical protein
LDEGGRSSSWSGAAEMVRIVESLEIEIVGENLEGVAGCSVNKIFRVRTGGSFRQFSEEVLWRLQNNNEALLLHVNRSLVPQVARSVVSDHTGSFNFASFFARAAAAHLALFFW